MVRRCAQPLALLVIEKLEQPALYTPEHAALACGVSYSEQMCPQT
jgi:hypothetical protein